MSHELKKYIENAIVNATVKVLINNEFRGTGFFITSDGYILTAYHCVLSPIEVETQSGDKFSAKLDIDKSLEDARYDIAVLKIEHVTEHYLPLGLISLENVTDDLVSVGYPAGDKNSHIGTYFGKGSRFSDDENKIECDVTRGQGQSGGAVYHYASQRVIALIVGIFMPKDVLTINLGLASRFDALFKEWKELSDINRETCKKWDNRLAQWKKTLSEPIDLQGEQPTQSKRHTQKSFTDRPLLRFLVNRRDQEVKLGKAIQQADYPPLFVCIVHGNEFECSERFVERLQQESLPKILPTKQTDSGIEHCLVQCDSVRDVNDLKDNILSSLGSKFLNNLYPSYHKIAQAIAKQKRPLILSIDLSTKDWITAGGMQLIQEFLQFWAKWEILSTQKCLLLICLSFHYKEVNKPSFLQKVFKKPSINQKIRETFNQLEQVDFVAQFQVPGVVLPELNSIEIEHVEHWVQNYLYEHVEILKPRIRKLFPSPNYKIPMEELAIELNRILADCA